MLDHALFISFAPANDPKLAVAVFVENGKHGGSTAAPIARKMFDAYLLPDKTL
jgi:penicillin-binding protein 2